MPDLVDQLARRLSATDIEPAWLDGPLPLSPWVTWTLVCLARQRQRQDLVGEVARDRLGADLAAIGAAGAFAHPDGPQAGIVPGMPDWEFYFHGSGCCLTHRGTGESIDVDFHEGGVDWIDLFFFQKRLKSLRTPSFAEQRLIELHPSLDGMTLAIDSLLAEGLLVENERGAVRLALDVTLLGPDLDPAAPRPDARRSTRIAAALGDWPYVATHAENDHLRLRAVALAQRLRDERTEELTGLYASKPTEALGALADLDSPHLAGFLRRALRGPVSGTTSRALEILETREDADWCDEVEALMRRVHPPGDSHPAPHLWTACARYLLARGHRPDAVCARLPRAGPFAAAGAAVIALEHAPAHAIPLFRQALRSAVPYTRKTAAAVLAVIDRPWCHRELLSALGKSRHHLATAECRAALRQCGAADLCRAVENWEVAHPRERETGDWITIEEAMLRAADDALVHEMERWSAHAAAWRAVDPPEPQRRWWRWRR